MSQSNRNLVLEDIGASQSAKTRARQLEFSLRALLRALKQQHLDGRAPGQYHYSGNVTDAMRRAEALVKATPDPPKPPKADQAKTL